MSLVTVIVTFIGDRILDTVDYRSQQSGFWKETEERVVQKMSKVKFNKYKTSYEGMKEFFTGKIGKAFPPAFRENCMKGYRTFYDYVRRDYMMDPNARFKHLAERQCRHEQHWYEANQPYYNVWPRIIEPLSHLDLKQVKCGQIRMPLEQLEIRLPKGDTTFVANTGHALKSILLCHENNEEGITFWMDFGERDESGIPVISWRRFPISDPEETIADVQARYEAEGHYNMRPGLAELTSELTSPIISMVLACLMINDDELITPDLLKRHQDKPFADWMVDHAHRERKVGWDVGKVTEPVDGREISPHFRRPHLALYHVGPGRKQQVVKLRKGSFVKREKAAENPTGYEGDEG